MHPDDADDLDLDDANIGHFAEHGVTASEVEQVWLNGPVWLPNKKGRAALWLMLGWTNGGRPLFVPVEVDEVRSRIRPVGARTCEKDEVYRWLK